MDNKFSPESGYSPLIILVISSLILMTALTLFNFNKTSVSNVSTTRKPLPSSSVDISPSAPQDGLDCLEESESGCDDSEDVPIDPEDLAGPD